MSLTRGAVGVADCVMSCSLGKSDDDCVHIASAQDETVTTRRPAITLLLHLAKKHHPNRPRIHCSSSTSAPLSFAQQMIAHSVSFPPLLFFKLSPPCAHTVTRAPAHVWRRRPLCKAECISERQGVAFHAAMSTTVMVQSSVNQAGMTDLTRHQSGRANSHQPP